MKYLHKIRSNFFFFWTDTFCQGLTVPGSFYPLVQTLALISRGAKEKPWKNVLLAGDQIKTDSFFLPFFFCFKKTNQKIIGHIVVELTPRQCLYFQCVTVYFSRLKETNSSLTRNKGSLKRHFQ